MKSFFDLTGFADINDCKILYNIKGGLAGVTCSGAYPSARPPAPTPNPWGTDSVIPPKKDKPKPKGPKFN